VTKSIPVHIIFVLDRSGSMSPIANDVIGGFNQFLAEQQAQEGKCRMTLVQFDGAGPFEVLADAQSIADVKPLDSSTYVPRGNTPLLDAEGRAIAKVEARIAERKAAGKKDEAVLFVTYTDGQENASSEHTHESLTAAKKRCEEAGWTFLYLGCGHDAYAQSHSVGTRMANTQSFASTSKGMRSAVANTSQVARSYRGAALKGDSVALASATMDAYATFNVAKDAEDEMTDEEKAKVGL
jgi:Mg-chelatase subunit ChlD